MVATAFHFAFGLSRAINDLASVGEAIDRVTLREGNAWDHLSIITRTSSLGIGAAQLIAALMGSSTKTMHQIKIIDTCIQGTNIPIEIGSAFSNSSLSTSQKVERSLRSVTAFSKTLMDEEKLRYKAMTELPPDEFNKLEYPVYKVDNDDNLVLVGYQHYNLDDCKALVDTLDGWSLAFGAVETACEFQLVSFSYNAIMSLFNNPQDQRPGQVANEAQQPVNHVQQAQAALAVAGNVFEMEVDEENFFDRFLLALPYIPEALTDDVVFSQYMCPILHRAIRHPVLDPTVTPNAQGEVRQVYYEASAIRAWVAQHPTSPWTQRPLFEDQIVIDPQAQAVIDARLMEHQQAVLPLINANANQPAGALQPH